MRFNPLLCFLKPIYMNRLITIALALSLGTSAQAQQSTTISPKLDVKKIAQSIFAQCLAKQANSNQLKTTAIKQRVVGESNLDLSQGVVVDSVRYVYSSNNGSKFIQGSTFYSVDYPPFILINSDISAYYAPNVSADSFYYFNLDTNQSLSLTNLYTAGYTNKKANFYQTEVVTSQIVDAKTFSLYDNNGRIMGFDNLAWDGTNMVLDSSDKRRLAFDAQGRLVRDTTYQYDLGDWNPYILMEYTYNGAGNITKVEIKFYATITWLSVGQMDITYNSDNKIKTFMISQFNGSSLVPDQTDSMTYNTGNSYPTKHWSSTYDEATSTWTPTTYNYIHSNAQGLADTFINYSWNGTAFDANEMYYMTYNSASNPVKYDYYTYVNGSPSISTTHNFYYEEYTDLSVGNIAQNNNDIVVYPNPTHNTVTVSLKNKAEVAQADFFNAMGQLVLHADFSSSVTLDASALVSGNYYVIVRNSKGEILGTEKIIKQ